MTTKRPWQHLTNRELKARWEEAFLADGYYELNCEVLHRPPETYENSTNPADADLTGFDQPDTQDGPEYAEAMREIQRRLFGAVALSMRDPQE